MSLLQQVKNNASKTLAKLDYQRKMLSSETGKEILITEAQASALGKNITIFTSSNAPILNNLGLLSVTKNIAIQCTKKNML